MRMLATYSGGDMLRLHFEVAPGSVLRQLLPPSPPASFPRQVLSDFLCESGQEARESRQRWLWRLGSLCSRVACRGGASRTDLLLRRPRGKLVNGAAESFARRLVQIPERLVRPDCEPLERPGVRQALDDDLVRDVVHDPLNELVHGIRWGGDRR